MTVAHEPEETCSICLELVSAATDGASRCSGCAGAFCKPCISTWVKAAATPSCPLCRQCIEIESPREFSPSFPIFVLVDWLLAKRSGFASWRASSLGPEAAAVLLETMLSIDNLLDNCTALLELPENAPEVLTFNRHLSDIQAAFTNLFATVDIALSHDRVANMFEEYLPRPLSS